MACVAAAAAIAPTGGSSATRRLASRGHAHDTGSAIFLAAASRAALIQAAGITTEWPRRPWPGAETVFKFNPLAPGVIGGLLGLFKNEFVRFTPLPPNARHTFAAALGVPGESNLAQDIARALAARTPENGPAAIRYSPRRHVYSVRYFLSFRNQFSSAPFRPFPDGCSTCYSS